jgi:hypothetical protein
LNEALCCDKDKPLPPVSAFAGLAIICGLGGICNRHARISRKQQHKNHSSTTPSSLQVEGSGSYPFWVQHFAIDKKLQAVSHCLFQQFQAQQQQQQQLHSVGPCDASTLIVYLNFYAVSIYLHKIGAEETVRAPVPDILKEDIDRRCESAAVQVASVLHQMHLRDTYNVNPSTCIPNYLLLICIFR